MKYITKRKPITVGEALEDLLDRFDISKKELSDAISVHRNTISKIVNDKQSLTVIMAAKIGKALGTSPEFWLNLQYKTQEWEANNDEAKEEIRNVKVLR